MNINFQGFFFVSHEYLDSDISGPLRYLLNTAQDTFVSLIGGL